MKGSCGLGFYVARAMAKDTAIGRLTFYDALCLHASRGHWPAFLLATFEYTELLGYNVSSRFEMPSAP